MAKFYICLALLLASTIGHARLLRIIHTNDLHSYFKGYRDGRGGYARLKTKIDELRHQASRDGIDVLQLDGGDFGEGTSFFLADEGAASLRALSLLGADVAVIGNHDHLLGGNVLGRQIRRSGGRTKFISANLLHTPEMELSGVVHPYADFNRGGIKIRVFGLSTAEPHFQYPMLPGFIVPPIPVGTLQSDLARQAGKELVIALTHVGYKTDEAIARNSSEIDLIVGGHSHTRLDEVVYVTNKKNRPVPIVQAGSHGLMVGSLLLEVTDSGAVEVREYEIHDIEEGQVPEDAAMANFVMTAAEDRNQYFGGRWDEIIGETFIPLSGYIDGKPVLRDSCWGKHMARMTREAAAADLGIHLAHFEGVTLPPGLITYGDMIDNYPHFSRYGDEGWEITTIRVKGYILKTILRAVINLKDQMGANLYGVRYRSILLPQFIPYIGGRRWAFGMRINGRKISNKDMYTIAFPSEVAMALKLTLPKVTQKLFPSLEHTGKYYWPMMENYIRENSPIQCL